MKVIAQADIASLLDKTTWAQDLQWPEIQQISRYFRLYSAEPQSWLFAEGDSADYMGLLIQGRLRITKTCADSGQPKVLAVLKPPQSFGEMALIDGLVRSAAAQVIEPVQFLATNQQQLFLMAEQHPKLAFKFLWKLTYLISQRLRQTSMKLTLLP